MSSHKQDAIILVESSNSFKARVEEFLTTVLGAKEKEKDIFRNELVRLILTIQVGAGANTLTNLAKDYNFFDDFKYFKKIYLDKSAYIHRTLWREIYYFIQNKSFKNDIPVLREDVFYCISYLQDSDIEKIILAEINHEVNASLDMSDPEFKTGLNKKRSLRAYAKSKTGSLKYLSKYDPAMTQQDFEQDIIEEALRINNIYNKSSGKNLSSSDKMEDAISKYIETGLNNYVNQVKDYWRSGIRSRVSSTHHNLYQKRENLKKAIETEKDEKKLAKLNRELKLVELEIKEGSSDYFSVLVPLVRTNESENREIDAQELDHEIIDDSTIEDKMWVKELLEDLPPRIARCVSIIMGAYDEDFMIWAKTKSVKKYNLDILEHLFKASMEFCKVTKNELRNNTVIVRALANSPATKKFFGQDKDDVLIQNITTKKVYSAKLEDARDDGTKIYNINSQSKYVDTNFDKKWRLV